MSIWHKLTTVLRCCSADVDERHEALQALYSRALDSGDCGLMRGTADEFDETARLIELSLPPRAVRSEAQRALGWLADELAAHADALRDAAQDTEAWGRGFRMSKLTWR